MELLTMSILEVTRLAALQRLERRELTQPQVACQLGLSVRQIKRLWRKYRSDGAAGLVSSRRGRPSNRRISPELVARALDLVRTHYADFGPTFAAEKLRERHDLRLDHETLRRAMLEAGLWKRSRKRRKTVHPPRERRPCFGELAQIDGSHHAWFEDRAPKCTLYVDVDDATSALLALYFDREETTEGYFNLLRRHFVRFGMPLAFYADKYSVFRINQQDPKSAQTQFGRAMDELGIELICANSPQAKGRVERANSTLQNRLVKELRLRNISSIEQANAFVPEFLELYNGLFAKEPACSDDAHREAPNERQLEKILCTRHRRTISKNLLVHFQNGVYEILLPQQARRLQHAIVELHFDTFGELRIERDGVNLPYREQARSATPTPVRTAKTLAPDRHVPNPKKGHPPATQHPWRNYPTRFA